jgi:4-carboxymuconolactone decarboxylase
VTRPSAARLEPVSDFSADLEPLLAKTVVRDGKPLNIFGVLAHHPKLLDRFNRLGGLLLTRGTVPAREREIVILRVGWRCRAIYEFGQHTLIGRQTGLTDAEIAALAGADDNHPWSTGDQVLIDLADDLCRDDCASDATWNALRPLWSDEQLVELVVCAGFYRLVSGFLNTMGVQLDEGVPGWPAGAKAVS